MLHTRHGQRLFFHRSTAVKLLEGLLCYQVPTIESLLSNTDSDVVVDACGALVKLDSKASLPVILPLLNDERTDVARVACEALGTLGNESNIPALETLLNDKRRSVRSEAKSSVKELHKKR